MKRLPIIPQPLPDNVLICKPSELEDALNLVKARGDYVAVMEPMRDRCGPFATFRLTTATDHTLKPAPSHPDATAGHRGE